jgi:hypothetical protein
MLVIDSDGEVRAGRLARIAVARRSPANGAGRTARPPSALVDAEVGDLSG